MYLAAVSDVMVSPSEIIDIVWHQHLIFTQSYADFCSVLGKNIQHVPSTHNREDFEKFRLAKERTKKFYTETFGSQPSMLWDYADMFEPLQLEKATYKIRTLTTAGVLIALLLTLPMFFLLKPIYIHINNPWFLIGYVGVAFFTLIGLRSYNRSTLMAITREWKPDAFIHHLKPDELMYAATKKIDRVIHGHVDLLIKQNGIVINADKKLQPGEDFSPATIEAYTIIDTLTALTPRTGSVKYSVLFNLVKVKPIFHNVSNCMDAFEKYFNKSKKFFSLFLLNFGVLSFIFILGLVRLFTGIVRGKPIDLLVMVLVVLLAAIVYFLWRLTKLISTYAVKKLYDQKLKTGEVNKHAWGWDYYTGESVYMDAAFFTIVHTTDKEHWHKGSSDGSSSGGSDSSCGSSCGSSCSSCGGCGGD